MDLLADGSLYQTLRLFLCIRGVIGRIGVLKNAPPASAATVTVEILRHRDGLGNASPDQLAREEPLEIRVRGKSIAVTMRTPGHDAELACGFLFSEGLLRERRDLVEVAACQTGENSQLGNILNVFVAPKLELDFDRLTRHTFASSSCGLCGKASIDSVHQHFAPVTSKATFDPDVIPRLPDILRAAQESFSKTGGLHAAGLLDLKGNLITSREDIGRHNAVDKVIGWAFLNRHLPLKKHLLFVSGRTSFEIMQKALAAQIPIVAAVSAPSSLAVEFAKESNQTLIGFVRGTSFNVYSGAERLKSSGRRAKLR
jgi:FdhD protein